MKVVIGFDNQEASGYIFNDLKAAGLPSDTQFHIVSATDMEAFASEAQSSVEGIEHPAEESWQSEISENERSYLLGMLHNAQRIAAEKEREMKIDAEGAAAELKAAFPSSHVDVSVVPVSPYSGIVTIAKRLQADLVVVGSQNATALSRFFLGSVSQKIVSHSDKSVRVARAHATTAPGKLRIIVGFDASADSQKVLDTVAARQWPAGTEIRVITVAEEKSLRFLLANIARVKSREELQGEPRSAEAVKSLAQAACDRLKTAGISAEALGVEGDPKKVLLEMADDWNADCIFIGAKGHQSGVSQPLGAVASVVTTRAHCSVEVVRW